LTNVQISMAFEMTRRYFGTGRRAHADTSWYEW
jgi:hypothetical protein